MRLTIIFIFMMSALWVTTDTFAAQQMTLVRLARSVAMGGTGVGLADDSDSLFLNPAGLAGVEERRFRLANVGLEASGDTYTSLGTITGGASASTLNALAGKDISSRAGETLMIVLPHFALSYLIDIQVALNEYNLANPYFNLGDMVTHGFQVGSAWSISSGRHPTSEFRFGFAAKLLWRRGGYYAVSTSGYLQATNGGTAYLNSLLGGYGIGYGGDVGVQYVTKPDSKTRLSFGASILDIGNTNFSDSNASSLPMNIGFGLGYKRDFNFGKLSIALDFRNLGDSTAFVNYTHFGTELKTRYLSLLAGLNELNYTAGVGFDLWFIKMTVLTTAEELGYAYGQDTSRSYMLQAEFDLPI